MKTLLALSDPEMREHAEKVLLQCGCSVTPVADGEAALRACEEQDFELIVLEQTLADGGG